MTEIQNNENDTTDFIAETSAHVPRDNRTMLKFGLVVLVALLSVTALYKIVELMPPAA